MNLFALVLILTSARWSEIREEKIKPVEHGEATDGKRVG